MFRLFVLIVCLAGLSSCAHDAKMDRAMKEIASTKQQIASDRSHCLMNGFKDGTKGFNRCMTDMKKVRASDIQANLEEAAKEKRLKELRKSNCMARYAIGSSEYRQCMQDYGLGF